MPTVCFVIDDSQFPREYDKISKNNRKSNKTKLSNFVSIFQERELLSVLRKSVSATIIILIAGDNRSKRESNLLKL